MWIFRSQSLSCCFGLPSGCLTVRFGKAAIYFDDHDDLPFFKMAIFQLANNVRSPGNPMEIREADANRHSYFQCGHEKARAAGGQELEESAMAKSQMTVISISFKVVPRLKLNR